MNFVPRLRSNARAAGAATVACATVAGIAAIGGTASAAAPAPCSIPSAPHTAGSQPLLGSVNVASPSGRVELHGELRSGFTVVACLASGQKIGTLEYTVEKAPKSKRYLLLQIGESHWNADGTGGTTEAQVVAITTEKQFNAAVKSYKRALTVPGLKGTLYAPSAGLPVEILASKAGQHTPITAKRKQSVAAAFLTGPQTYKPQR